MSRSALSVMNSNLFHCKLRQRLIFFWQHWHVDSVTPGCLYGLRITGVGVADNPHAGIGGQHSLQAARGLRRAIGDDHLTGVLAVADADATAMMEGYPGGAANGVNQGV